MNAQVRAVREARRASRAGQVIFPTDHHGPLYSWAVGVAATRCERIKPGAGQAGHFGPFRCSIFLAGSARPSIEKRSDAFARFEPSQSDRLDEVLEVAFVLVGVAQREVGDHLVERVSAAQVLGDRDRVP